MSMAPPVVDPSKASSSAELVRGYVDVEAQQCVDEIAWQEPLVCEEPAGEPVDVCAAGAQLQQLNGAARGFAGANRFAANASAAMQPQQPQVSQPPKSAPPPPPDNPEVEKAVQPTGKGDAVDLLHDDVIRPFMARNEFDLKLQMVTTDDVRNYGAAALIVDDKVSEQEVQAYAKDYKALEHLTANAQPQDKERVRQEWQKLVARNKELYCLIDGTSLNVLHGAASAAHPFEETISSVELKPEQLEQLRFARDAYVRRRGQGGDMTNTPEAKLLGLVIRRLDIPGARAAGLADHVIETGVPNYQPSFEQFWKDCHPEKKGTEVASR